jgi:hypothetical protein
MVGIWKALTPEALKRLSVAARKTELRVPVKYRFSRRLHALAFDPDAPLFPAPKISDKVKKTNEPGMMKGGPRQCRISSAHTS